MKLKSIKRIFKPLSMIVLLLSMVVIMVSCTPKAEPYHKITAEEAKTMMDSGEPYILVDVRTEMEYADGHIQGALLIPNESIADSPPELLPDKKSRILIYCRSGNRSKQASDKLVKMGYENIYDFGGIINWPYGIEK